MHCMHSPAVVDEGTVHDHDIRMHPPHCTAVQVGSVVSEAAATNMKCGMTNLQGNQTRLGALLGGHLELHQIGVDDVHLGA